MIYLSCETSTLLGSVAVFKDHKLISYRESMRQGSHSEALNVFVDEALNEAGLKISDVDLFVSGIGPGSFTGIRISLNTIKTYAYCHNKPVLAINSLENLGSQVEESDLPIVTMLNAYKNMVYIATYAKKGSDLIEVKPPEVIRVQLLDQYITETCYVVGDGYTTYAKYFSPAVQGFIRRPQDAKDEPKASAISHLVQKKISNSIHWSELVPLYLRASEAEEIQQGIKFQPL